MSLKSFMILGAVALLLALGVVFVPRQQLKLAPPVSSASNTQSQPQAPVLSFQQLGLQAIPPAKVAKRNTPQDEQLSCKVLNTAGLERAFNDFFRDLQQGLLDESLSPAACRDTRPETVSFLAQCSRDADRQKNDCRRLALEWRAALIEDSTQHVPLAEIDNLTILANQFVRLAGRIFEKGQQEQLPALRALTERMYELAPDHADIARLSIWGLATEPHALGDAATWQTILARIDRMSTGKGRTVAHDEFAVAMRVSHELERFTSDPNYDFGALDPVLEDFRVAYPTSGFPSYIEANLAYRRGDTAKAQKLVQEALRFEPERPQYQKSGEALKNLLPSEAPKSGLFSIGFNLPLSFAESP